MLTTFRFDSAYTETKGQHLSQIQLPSFDHFAHGTSRPAPRNSNSNGSRHAPHRDSNASQARSPGHRDSNASERDRDHGPDKGGTRRMSGVETGTADGEQESAGPDLGSGRIAEWDEDRATLVPGLIDEKEERALFQLFFDRINVSSLRMEMVRWNADWEPEQINAALLDPRLHTYEYVRKKSLFLLTVSEYYLLSSWHFVFLLMSNHIVSDCHRLALRIKHGHQPQKGQHLPGRNGPRASCRCYRICRTWKERRKLPGVYIVDAVRQPNPSRRGGQGMAIQWSGHSVRIVESTHF